MPTACLGKKKKKEKKIILDFYLFTSFGKALVLPLQSASLQLNCTRLSV